MTPVQLQLGSRLCSEEQREDVEQSHVTHGHGYSGPIEVRLVEGLAMSVVKKVKPYRAFVCRAEND